MDEVTKIVEQRLEDIKEGENLVAAESLRNMKTIDEAINLEKINEENVFEDTPREVDTFNKLYIEQE